MLLISRRENTECLKCYYTQERGKNIGAFAHFICAYCIVYAALSVLLALRTAHSNSTFSVTLMNKLLYVTSTICHLLTPITKAIFG